MNTTDKPDGVNPQDLPNRPTTPSGLLTALQSKGIELLNSILKEPYAWPGGYERLLITEDGALLCSKCVKSESHRILVDIQDGYNTGWLPVGATYEAVSAEFAREAGADTHRCDHCNREFGELGA